MDGHAKALVFCLAGKGRSLPLAAVALVQTEQQTRNRERKVKQERAPINRKWCGNERNRIIPLLLHERMDF
jgi:protein-tyrosine phosphatase